VWLAEDPEAAWEEVGPYFLHELNAYGAWHAASDVDTPYTSVSDMDELRAGDQYRILTPEEYRTELEAGGMLYAVLNPMVGGIPPEIGWRQLRLFESALL
jgi:hypothetical protein